MNLTKFLFFAFLLATASVSYGQAKAEISVSQTVAVQIFPNPATEYVNVKFESFEAQDVMIKLHNIIGNEIKTEVEVVNPHEIRLKVKDLATGYYLIAVREEKQHFSGVYKFLKR